MDNSALFMNLLVAVLGGAVRVGTPFLMVSLAECITEKSGRITSGSKACWCSRRWPASVART